MALDNLKVNSTLKAFMPLARKINKIVDLLALMEGKGGIKVTASDGKIIIEGSASGSGVASELHYLDANVQIDIDGSGVKVENLATGDLTKLDYTGALWVTEFSAGKQFLFASGAFTFTDGTLTLLQDSGGLKLSNDSTGDYTKIYPTGSLEIYQNSTGKSFLFGGGASTFTDGTSTIDQGSGGVRVTNDGSGDYAEFDSTGALNVSSGGKLFTFSGGVMTFADGSITLTQDENGVKLSNDSTGDYTKIYATGAFGVTSVANSAELLISPGDITHDMAVREIDFCTPDGAKKILIIGSEPYDP